jgi:hypothetical protein
MALLLPIFAFLGLLIFYRTIVLGWPWAVRCIYLAGCVFLGCVGLLSWLDYTTIIVAEPQTVPPRPDDWDTRATSEYAPFLNLSTPRFVRISWKGWLRIIVGVICLGVVFILAIPPVSVDFGEHFLRQLREAALPIGVLLLIGGLTNLNLARQRRSHLPLFKSGTVVIGRVVQQRFQNITIGMDMIWRCSLVEYEFRDREGIPISGKGHDYSKSLFQEMPVLLFYKEEDASRNVALGCSLYEVKSR